MAAHNYFSYGTSINQYSSATGVYNATAAYTQAVSPQVYNVSQQHTAQYGPYGNRIPSYDEQSSYYSQQTPPTAVPAATVLPSSGYGTITQSDGYSSSGIKSSYSSIDKYQNAAKSASYQTLMSGGGSVSTPAYQTQSTKQSYSTTSSSYGTPSYKKTNAKVSDWSSGAASSSDKKISQWHHTTTGSGSGNVSKFGSTSLSYTQTESSESNNASSSTIQLSGLDKALFTIASNFAQNQQKVTGLNQRATWWNKKGKMPTDPSQWKYCELCKMTCPGPQAYKLHIEGKTHKKKEAAVACASTSTPTGPQAPMASSKGKSSYCTVCDVACSSQDAYTAHIRGAKHQKVVKLMQRMGKPVPEENISVSAIKTAGTADVVKSVAPTAVVKKVVCAPRINFVGGTQLKSTGSQLEEVAVNSVVKNDKSFIGPVKNESFSMSPAAGGDDSDFIDGDVQPVGLEYLEEGMNDAGTAPSFYCKLCECHFTDVMAKIMHTKGRRHRLQYKKKVDPTLRVELKVTPFDRRFRRNLPLPDALAWRKREMQATYKLEAEELRYEKEYLEWKLQEAAGSRYLAPSASFAGLSPSNSLQFESSYYEELDRSIQLRHKAIYPSEHELTVIQSMVAACEKALKLVSDNMASSSAGQNARQLKGVMRVGLLSKGLLLQEHVQLQLVVLCSDKPTHSLVNEIAQQLPRYLEPLEDQKYEVTYNNGDILVTYTVSNQQPIPCTISLTSPSVKDEPGDVDFASETSEQQSDPVDVLDKIRCIKLLAELRHAKWFQARVTPQLSCLVVIRLLMDLCRRNASWAPLSQWALELLVEKAVSSAGVSANMTASDAFIRVLECISSGVLLAGEAGVKDVCEKEQTDASDCLSNENREEITRSAQHMLREVALGMAYKVLDVEPLPLQPNAAGNGASMRKRPRMASN